MAYWNWDKINETLDERFLDIFHYYCGTDYKGTPRLNKPAKIKCIVLGSEDRIASGAVYADHYYSYSTGDCFHAIQLIQFYEHGDRADSVRRAFEIIGEEIPTKRGREEYQGYVPRPAQSPQPQESNTPEIDEEKFTQEKIRRNSEYEKIPAQLEDWQLDDLQSRGLSIKDIQRGRFKSVTKGQKISGCKFPGITDGKVFSRSGYLVPLYDEKGRVTACQVKTQSTEAKYVVFGQAEPAKYDFSEYPLTFLPSINGDTVYLTEGILKPFVCSALAPNYHWVGAVSSNWVNGILQLSRFTKNYEIKKIIICPDAGLMMNAPLAKRYVEQAREIKKVTGCEITFGNWGQLFDKEQGLDPDEMLLDSKGKSVSKPLENIQELTISEWEMLLKQSSGDAREVVSQYQEMSALETWKHTYKFTPDYEVNSRFLDVNDAKLAPPKQREILAIKSGLGTGKTQLLKIFTEGAWKDEGIVALGPLNSLLKQTAWRCNWTHSWSNKGTGFLQLNNPQGKVAMCAHSLHRGDVTDYVGKYLVFDEVTQTIDCLLHDPSLSGIRYQLLDKLRWVLLVAKGIILLDGNLTDFVCDFFQQLSGFSLRKVENVYGVPDRKVTVISGSPTLKSGRDYSTIVDGIVADLSKGLKPVIASDSQKECEALDKILTDLGYTGLRIDSRTSGGDLIQQFLVDPDAFLLGHEVNVEKMKQLSLLEESNQAKNKQKIQYLIYSPTAQSGLSVSCEYFDKFYGVFKGVLGASEIYQMLYRVRLTRDADRVIYCPQNLINRTYLYAESKANTVSNLSKIAYQEINNLSLFQSREIKRIFAANLNSIECETSWYYQSRLDYESTHLRDCVIRLLESSGIEVQLVSELGDKEILSEISEVKEEIEIEEAKKLYETELISEAEYKELKSKPSNDIEAQRKIKKYQMNQALPGCTEHKDFDAEFIRWFDKNLSLIKAIKLRYQVDNQDFDINRESYWYSNSRLLPWLYQNYAHKASVLASLPLQPLIDVDEFSGQSEAVQKLVSALDPSVCFLLKLKKKKQPIAIVKSVLGLLGYGVKQTRRSNERYYQLVNQLDCQHTYYNIVTQGVEKYMERIKRTSQKQVDEARDGEVFFENLGQSLEPQSTSGVEPTVDSTDNLQFSYIQKSNLSVGMTPEMTKINQWVLKELDYDSVIQLASGLGDEAVQYAESLFAESRTNSPTKPEATLLPQQSTEQKAESDMWFLVEEAIAAGDCFPEVWSAVKAMGQKYADAVYDKYPELVRNADPEWVLSGAF